MSIDERQRHELYEKLDEVLGTEQADTMMAHLPPVGWADVATKQDLDHLSEVLTLRMDKGFIEVRAELQVGLANLRTEFHQGMRRQLVGIYGSVLVGLLVNQVLDKVL